MTTADCAGWSLISDSAGHSSYDAPHGDGQAQDAAELSTLEALAEGVRIIANPQLTVRIPVALLQDNRPGVDIVNPWWAAEPTNPALRADDDIIIRTAPDLLVRVDSSPIPHEARYMPVNVSTHQGIIPDPKNRIMSVALARLGVSAPVWRPGRAKTHSPDVYPLIAAHYALREVGLSSGMVGIVGQNSPDVAVWPVDKATGGFADAVRVPISAQPRKIKACSTCRFEDDCHAELEAMDDISLVLHGGRADTYRADGITTVHQLANAAYGEVSIMAYAYTQGWTAVHRTVQPQEVVRRADVEIDVDMEAYLDRGCYLWGTWDGVEYRPFITWQQLNTVAEARNFAQFWAWLMDQRQHAHERGQSFAAYCYGAQGENMWLKRSAQRFGGLTFPRDANPTSITGPTPTVTAPTLAEVNQFIRSPEWVDVYAAVNSALIGSSGLGLKTVAPLAGFHWEDSDMDGEASLAVFMQAQGIDPRTTLTASTEAQPDGFATMTDTDARALLLRYNRDDCRATAAVRNWLTAGAPGVHTMPTEPRFTTDVL